MTRGVWFAAGVAWGLLLSMLIGLAGGCGAVSVATVDATSETHTADAASTSQPSDADASEAAPTVAAPDAREAATCATATSPPYCASCRDARGVCMCGALPCCDQHCQS